jgi:hypothetical protein
MCCLEQPRWWEARQSCASSHGLHANSSSSLFVPCSRGPASFSRERIVFLQPTCASGTPDPLLGLPDFTVQGPLLAQKLPKLEHTCIRCFPACQINKCLLRVEVWYPKGGMAIGQAPPHPLAIFSSGFLIPSEHYRSYARRLTSWGYTVMLYDKIESAVDAIDDEVSAQFVSVRAHP